MPAPALALALALALPACCPHWVDQRPKEEIARTHGQSLRLINASSAPLELLPQATPSAPTPSSRLLAPGEETHLDFVLRQLKTRASTHDVLIEPVTAAASPFVGWSNPDLVLRIRFDGQPAEEVRIVAGECVFQPDRNGRQYSVRLDGPPLPGVPALRLCE
jgi:hypothetical protein